jgi:hypothetical protein
MSKNINKLVLVVLSADTRVVRERWEFDIQIMEPEASEDGSMCVPVLMHIDWPRF